MRCCKRTYLQNSIIGVYQPDLGCPAYCMEVNKISDFPLPEQCPSRYAFVNNAPATAYGGFTYQSGAWASIFTLMNIRYVGWKVEYIDGKLLPEFSLAINGQLYSPAEVLAGINFIAIYGEPIATPIVFKYHRKDCILDGQILI